MQFFSALLMIFMGGILPLFSFSTTAGYFSYSPHEVVNLSSRHSTKAMNKEEVDKWDRVLLELSNAKNLPDGYLTRFRAYVFVGQNEAARLSNYASGSFTGTLDPTTLKIIQIFFPDFTAEKAPDFQTDFYSENLSEMVAEKLKARFLAEKRKMTPYAIKKGEGFWEAAGPPVGITMGHATPWILTSASEFRPQAPPEYLGPEWRKELRIVQKAVKNITPEEKQKVLFWDGKSSPRAGNWIYLADDYMNAHQVPLDKYLQVRSDLAMAQFDAMVAVFDAKYEYFYPRPNQADKTLKTIIETPNHPSYPAGHSIASSAAAEVLAFYFPDNASEWRAMDAECGLSRIWAGLHYPIDIQVGAQMGKKIGLLTLHKLQRNTPARFGRR